MLDFVTFSIYVQSRVDKQINKVTHHILKARMFLCNWFPGIPASESEHHPGFSFYILREGIDNPSRLRYKYDESKMLSYR